MLNSKEYHKVNKAIFKSIENNPENPAEDFIKFFIENKGFAIKKLVWNQVGVSFPKRKFISETIIGEYAITQLVFGDLFSGIAKFTCTFKGKGEKKTIFIHESMSLDNCKEKSQIHFEDLIKESLIDKIPERFTLYDENYNEVFNY